LRNQLRPKMPKRGPTDRKKKIQKGEPETHEKKFSHCIERKTGDHIKHSKQKNGREKGTGKKKKCTTDKKIIRGSRSQQKP